MVRSRWMCSAMVALAMVATTAHAQSTSAEAEKLFRDGKSLMKERKYGEACAAFEASQNMDPSLATLLSLADCREKNWQIASAWGAFLDAERQTRKDSSQAALNKTAKDRAAKLEPRLSMLTVSVPDESRVDGLIILRNGEPIEEGSWNRAIPVDGGDYTIAGRAPGHEEWTTTVNVTDENGRASVDVPKFKAVEKLIEPEVDHSARRDGPDVIVLTDRPSPLTKRRKIALGVVGVGVLGAAGGIVFGLQAKGFESDAKELCPNNPCGVNADAANDARKKAETRALFTNISYGVAGVAVIAAAVLWITGAPEHTTEVQLGEDMAIAPVVTPSAAGVAVVGRF